MIAVGRVLAAMALATTVLTPPSFELPRPTGRFAIGTTSWHVTDAARPETFAEPGVSREVEVFAWYPASASGRRAPAPYLRDGLQEVQGFASLLGTSVNMWDGLADVKTHARIDAAPESAERRPVLVFSHGYGGLPSAGTSLVEDLASHGFIVLSIVHPYESAAAKLADGRFVSFLKDAGTLRQGYLDVVGEWAKEDKIMASVTQASGDDEQRRLLRGYISAIPRTTEALHRWVADTKLVLDRWSMLPPASVGRQLAARADWSRLGVFGHSMGGVTAGQFCVEDRRCAAGLNLDGIPQSGTMIDAALARPFLMVYSARPGRLGASDAIYRHAASRYIRVDVADTLHLDFTDMNFWGGPLRERGVYGAIAPARAAEVTRTIVREYFEQELVGQVSPLLSRKWQMDGVTVR